MILILFIISLQLVTNINCLCKTEGSLAVLGVVTTYDNTTVDCSNDGGSCIYLSINYSNFARGTINSCKSAIDSIFNKTVFYREDIMYLFVDTFDSTDKSFSISEYCITLSGKDFTRNALTGDIQTYINCYNTNTGIPNLTTAPHYDSGTLKGVPTKCGTEQYPRICTEGYCAMYEMETIDMSNNIIFQQSNYCPYEVFNQMYHDYTNNMYRPIFKEKIKEAASFCNVLSYSEYKYIDGIYSYYLWTNCFTNNLSFNNKTFPEPPDFSNYGNSPINSSIPSSVTVIPITTTTKFSISTYHINFLLLLITIFYYIF
uniref:Fgf-3 n=1 Tax=Parastrongyloides trichosuri TaxID=131310 RepID=A0A0N5A6A5_PARTI